MDPSTATASREVNVALGVSLIALWGVCTLPAVVLLLRWRTSRIVQSRSAIAMTCCAAGGAVSLYAPAAAIAGPDTVVCDVNVYCFIVMNALLLGGVLTHVWHAAAQHVHQQRAAMLLCDADRADAAERAAANARALSPPRARGASRSSLPDAAAAGGVVPKGGLSARGGVVSSGAMSRIGDNLRRSLENSPTPSLNTAALTASTSAAPSSRRAPPSSSSMVSSPSPVGALPPRSARELNPEGVAPGGTVSTARDPSGNALLRSGSSRAVVATLSKGNVPSNVAMMSTDSGAAPVAMAARGAPGTNTLIVSTAPSAMAPGHRVHAAPSRSILKSPSARTLLQHIPSPTSAHPDTIEDARDADHAQHDHGVSTARGGLQEMESGTQDVTAGTAFTGPAQRTEIVVDVGSSVATHGTPAVTAPASDAHAAPSTSNARNLYRPTSMRALPLVDVQAHPRDGAGLSSRAKPGATLSASDPPLAVPVLLEDGSHGVMLSSPVSDSTTEVDVQSLPAELRLRIPAGAQWVARDTSSDSLGTDPTLLVESVAPSAVEALDSALELVRQRNGLFVLLVVHVVPWLAVAIGVAAAQKREWGLGMGAVGCATPSAVLSIFGALHCVWLVLVLPGLALLWTSTDAFHFRNESLSGVLACLITFALYYGGAGARVTGSSYVFMPDGAFTALAIALACVALLVPGYMASTPTWRPAAGGAAALDEAIKPAPASTCVSCARTTGVEPLESAPSERVSAPGNATPAQPESTGFDSARVRSSLVITEKRSNRTVLEDLLKDPLGRMLFAAHLQKEFGLELVLFYVEVARFRKRVTPFIVERESAMAAGDAATHENTHDSMKHGTSAGGRAAAAQPHRATAAVAPTTTSGSEGSASRYAVAQPQPLLLYHRFASPLGYAVYLYQRFLAADAQYRVTLPAALVVAVEACINTAAAAAATKRGLPRPTAVQRLRNPFSYMSHARRGASHHLHRSHSRVFWRQLHEDQGSVRVHASPEPVSAPSDATAVRSAHAGDRRHPSVRVHGFVADADILPSDVFDEVQSEAFRIMLQERLPRFMASTGYALYLSQRPNAAKAVSRSRDRSHSSAAAGGLHGKSSSTGSPAFKRTAVVPLPEE